MPKASELLGGTLRIHAVANETEQITVDGAPYTLVNDLSVSAVEIEAQADLEKLAEQYGLLRMDPVQPSTIAPETTKRATILVQGNIGASIAALQKAAEARGIDVDFVTAEERPDLVPVRVEEIGPPIMPTQVARNGGHAGGYKPPYDVLSKRRKRRKMEKQSRRKNRG